VNRSSVVSRRIEFGFRDTEALERPFENVDSEGRYAVASFAEYTPPPADAPKGRGRGQMAPDSFSIVAVGK
jgi:hypothetical protein